MVVSGGPTSCRPVDPGFAEFQGTGPFRALTGEVQLVVTPAGGW